MRMREFLDTPPASALSQAEWARRFKITRGYLNQLVSGGKLPSLPMAVAIHHATGGQVTPFDWLPEEPSHAGSGD